jgi:hypothetical protein
VATDWSTTADYSFSQQDLWKAKQSGTAEDEHDFKGVAEAPENMMLDPEDYDIFPEEIQVDNESWTSVSVAKEHSTSWSLVNTETD